jgi:glutamyl-tRNA reductase
MQSGGGLRSLRETNFYRQNCALSHRRNKSQSDNYALPFYRYEDNTCVQHLFRVASGLDSMVVGESEIFGQAKKAYELARTSGAVGPYLHRLFQRAFRVAKQVRTHTDIARGAVSVGSVAVELAQRIFGRLTDCKVLVLGAGETSERTTRALVSRGVWDLRVSNRSVDRARELAQTVGGRAVPFDDWVSQCREDRHSAYVNSIRNTVADFPIFSRRCCENAWIGRSLSSTSLCHGMSIPA